MDVFCCQYEELGGIPLKVLREKLQDTSITEDIPQDRVDLLLTSADKNRDGRMSYNEFIKLVGFDNQKRKINTDNQFEPTRTLKKSRRRKSLMIVNLCKSKLVLCRSKFDLS